MSDLMKRASCFLISAVVLVLLGSCARPVQEPEPQAALAGYFDALIGGNHEEAAKFLSAQTHKQADAKPRDGDSFEARMVRRALASYVSYEIAVIEKNEGTARMAAKIKAPDFQSIARDIAARLSAARFPEGGLESLDYTAEIVNSQIRALKAKGIPMVSSSRNYDMVREGGSWKISGWE
jgi:hypothetical protein